MKVFFVIHATWLLRVTTSITALLAKLIIAKTVDQMLMQEPTVVNNNNSINQTITLNQNQLERPLINSVPRETSD